MSTSHDSQTVFKKSFATSSSKYKWFNCVNMILWDQLTFCILIIYTFADPNPFATWFPLRRGSCFLIKNHLKADGFLIYSSQSRETCCIRLHNLSASTHSEVWIIHGQLNYNADAIVRMYGICINILFFGMRNNNFDIAHRSCVCVCLCHFD